jgi:hypothetical protein
MTACILLAWLELLARDRDLAKAEPKGFGWSGGVRHRLDALPGGDDVVFSGLGSCDLKGSASSATAEAGGGVQEAVGQGHLGPVEPPATRPDSRADVILRL